MFPVHSATMEKKKKKKKKKRMLMVGYDGSIFIANEKKVPAMIVPARGTATPPDERVNKRKGNGFSADLLADFGGL